MTKIFQILKKRKMSFRKIRTLIINKNKENWRMIFKFRINNSRIKVIQKENKIKFLIQKLRNKTCYKMKKIIIIKVNKNRNLKICKNQKNYNKKKMNKQILMKMFLATIINKNNCYQIVIKKQKSII